MPLERTTISLPFAQGVDTKTDTKQIRLGKLITLENGVFETPQSVRKRNGSTTLAFGLSNIRTSYGLMSYKDQLLNIGDTGNIGGSELKTWSPNAQAWGQFNYITPFGLRAERMFDSTQVQPTANMTDMAVHEDSGIGLMAWSFLESGGNSNIRYTVFDVESGAKIEATAIPTPINHVLYQPKVLVFDKYLVLIFNDHTSNILRVNAIDTTNPAGAAIAFALPVGMGTTNTVAEFDAAVSGNRLFITQLDQGTTSLKVMYYDTALTPSGVITVNSTTPSKPAIWGQSSNQNVWIAYNSGGVLKAKVYDNGLGIAFAEFTVDATTGQTITGVYMPPQNLVKIIWNSTTKTVLTRDINASAPANGVADGVLIRSIHIYSRLGLSPMEYEGVFLGSFRPNETTASPNLFLIHAQGTSFKIIAKMDAQLSREDLAITANLNQSVDRLTLDSSSAKLTDTEYMSLGMTWFRMNYNTYVSNSEIANDLHLGTGVLSLYDGQVVTEHGFHTYPIGALGVPAGAGGLLSAGSYSYKFTYEWIDSQGNLYRSSPSDPLQVTTVSGTSQVALDLPTLRITNKYSGNGSTPVTPLKIAIYRTQVNGLTYNLVTTVTNDVTVDSLVYVDIAADSAILGNVELYTDGGEVPNGEPGAICAMTTYKNRLIVIPSEDRLSFWFSKTVVPNVPAEFSPDFVQQIEPRGGDITAVAALDDKLVLFKKELIIATTGEGPALNGEGNDFNQGQVIATDTGCTSTPSVVLMPDGLMYQSAKGIELLDRGLGTHFIGAEVEEFTTGNVVVSATLIRKLNQVRFAINSGVILTYDYFVKDERGIGQWSVFTNYVGIASTAEFQGVLAYSMSNGEIYQENTGFQDRTGGGGSNNIAISIRTPWISLAGLQGFQRIYKALILGEWKSAHTLLVEIAYDFNPTTVQTETIVASTLTTPYQWRILLARQKCEAVQFKISDSGTGESLRLSAIALEVGIKGGLQRAGKTRTFG